MCIDESPRLLMKVAPNYGSTLAWGVWASVARGSARVCVDEPRLAALVFRGDMGAGVRVLCVRMLTDASCAG